MTGQWRHRDPPRPPAGAARTCRHARQPPASGGQARPRPLCKAEV